LDSPSNSRLIPEQISRVYVKVEWNGWVLSIPS
jgi:hypothetical protein